MMIFNNIKKHLFWGICWVFILLSTSILHAQQESFPNEEFTYEEFLAVVKKYHPLVKQADLIITNAEAKLLKARGYFDPKLSADFSKKRYHDQKYYSVFNGSFKIPTWYGIEIKAAFDQNEGYYLNPEHKVPEDGLASLGITVPIGQGLWINERMAELKKGKMYIKLGAYERTLAVVEAIYEASATYMDWKMNYEKMMLYKTFYDNAVERQEWIKKSIVLGELSPIDSVESGINLKTRKLEWEQAKLKLTKSRLELSNYVWSEDGVPLELSEEMKPEDKLQDNIVRVLNLNPVSQDNDVTNHPKINALSTKLSMQQVDRKLKANKLLPKLSLSYNYIAEPGYFNNYYWDDYKIGATLSFPVFLRKERAEVRMADNKLREAAYGLNFQKQALQNKIKAQYAALDSYQQQLFVNADLVNDYQQMLDAESRLFEMGESSIFYINTRENKLVKSKVSQIELKNTYFLAAAGLYKTLAEF
ncbi:TolC family protein [Zhouia sp. PK063]|uniref:TolC family protein n=1 Tax=Zhouia sp. PK063 TaxID=3373602 RepID=UPI0037924F43